MTQYVIFDCTEDLSLFLTDKVQRYTNEALIAATRSYIAGAINPCHKSYESLAAAQESLAAERFPLPIFIMDTANEITGAVHRTNFYDLSATWKEHQALRQEHHTLELFNTIFVENKEINGKIFKVRQELLKQEGTIPYKKLEELCKATNELLTDPTPTRITAYKKIAESQRRSFSSTDLLYWAMLALATACTALAIATVNSPIVFSIAGRAAGYSLIGAVSFFKEGEGGLCKSMNEVATSQKVHDAGIVKREEIAELKNQVEPDFMAQLEGS